MFNGQDVSMALRDDAGQGMKFAGDIVHRHFEDPDSAASYQSLMDDPIDQGEVDIPSADDKNDLFPSEFPGVFHQRCQRHGSSAFDDHLLSLHEQEDGHGDGFFIYRHQVIHKVLHDLEG